LFFCTGFARIVSIPFSAGQRLKDNLAYPLDGKYELTFLSLFQQGKDLKKKHKQNLHILMMLVSIPFSAGQRLKACEFLIEVVKSNAEYGFYPFFSRAKT